MKFKKFFFSFAILSSLTIAAFSSSKPTGMRWRTIQVPGQCRNEYVQSVEPCGTLNSGVLCTAIYQGVTRNVYGNIGDGVTCVIPLYDHN